jgi:hypothetical protein
MHFSPEAADYLRYDKKPAWFAVYERQTALAKTKQIAMKYRLPVLLTTQSAQTQSLKVLGGTFLMPANPKTLMVQQLDELLTAKKGNYIWTLPRPWSITEVPVGTKLSDPH